MIRMTKQQELEHLREQVQSLQSDNTRFHNRRADDLIEIRDLKDRLNALRNLIEIGNTGAKPTDEEITDATLGIFGLPGAHDNQKLGRVGTALTRFYAKRANRHYL